MAATIRSGQTNISSPGSEQPLATGLVARGPIAIRALSTNLGSMYVGNAGDGTVSSTSGYELSPGDQIILNHVHALDTILVDAAQANEKVCWLILGSTE